MRSQEYKEGTTTDVGKRGLFMRGSDWAEQDAANHGAAAGKLRGAKNDAKPGARDSAFSFTFNI